MGEISEDQGRVSPGLHWHALNNQPGCLPEEEPTTHAMWGDAQWAIRSDLKREQEMCDPFLDDYHGNLKTALMEVSNWTPEQPHFVYVKDDQGRVWNWEIQGCHSAECVAT